MGGGLCKTEQADLIPRIFASDLELTGESCLNAGSVVGFGYPDRGI